ncbi:MAG: hypothetical protein HZA49_04070 [Planctomycetes bacterium]|nr:hypothetical protein [Planctomycetota bacterium]
MLPTIDKTAEVVDNKTDNNIYQDFKEFKKYPDEVLFFIRCAWNGIDDYIGNADFCIIADREMLKREPLAPKPELKPAPEPEKVETKVDDTTKDIKDIIIDIVNKETDRHKHGYDPWEKVKIDERIKVHSVIFGDVPEKEILISRMVNPPDDNPYYDDLYMGRYIPLNIPIAIPLSPPPDNKNQKMILFGYKKGNECHIIFSLWAGQEIVSLQAIRAIEDLWLKEWRGKQDVFLAEKQDLLDNSNNSEVLGYLFRRCQLYGNISETVELIKRLSENNPSMPNRKFLSFGFSLYTLYDLDDQNVKADMDKWSLNESQKQTLIAIATKKLSEVTSISEGLKFLRLIGMFNYDPTIKYVADNTEWSKEKWDEFNSPAPIDSPLFKKVPALKDNLKAVAQTLSKRFENDKDYPEWQKWVDKIFPEDQTPETIEKAK